MKLKDLKLKNGPFWENKTSELSASSLPFALPVAVGVVN